MTTSLQRDIYVNAFESEALPQVIFYTLPCAFYTAILNVTTLSLIKNTEHGDFLVIFIIV